MTRLYTRVAFVLALLAVATASFVAPAHAGKRLLEVRNKTDYVLHFACKDSATGVVSEVGVLPGGTWGLEKAGSYYFTGSLQKPGAATISLQPHGILLKENQGVLMVLLAVYDNVGSKSYRWYTYNQ
jgi:hypothetical protein